MKDRGNNSNNRCNELNNKMHNKGKIDKDKGRSMKRKKSNKNLIYSNSKGHPIEHLGSSSSKSKGDSNNNKSDPGIHSLVSAISWTNSSANNPHSPRCSQKSNN